jgi:hypothetical protein
MTQQLTQLITVENQSTLSPIDAFNLAWSVGYQLRFQYGRSRWVTGGYAPPARATLLPKGVKPPAGAWNLILLDNSDQAGALGYHDDETGSQIPYADVFCKTAIADGATPSSVASHEALEMLVDPHVTSPRTALRKDTQQLYIVELCDAVQGNDYDVGAPEGRVTGTMVADFCLPAWWELEPGTQFSYRSSVAGPWQLAPQGYISVAPVANPSAWSQIYGAQQDRLPAWASRLSRIHPDLNTQGGAP